MIRNDSKQLWNQHNRIIELISKGGDCVKSAYCVEWGLHCMLMNTEVPWKWEVELSEEHSSAIWFLPNSPSPTRQGFPGAQIENPLITCSTDCRQGLHLYDLNFHKGRAWYYVTACEFQGFLMGLPFVPFLSNQLKFLSWNKETQNPSFLLHIPESSLPLRELALGIRSFSSLLKLDNPYSSIVQSGKEMELGGRETSWD